MKTREPHSVMAYYYDKVKPQNYAKEKTNKQGRTVIVSHSKRNAVALGLPWDVDAITVIVL